MISFIVLKKQSSIKNITLVDNWIHGMYCHLGYINIERSFVTTESIISNFIKL